VRGVNGESPRHGGGDGRGLTAEADTPCANEQAERLCRVGADNSGLDLEPELGLAVLAWLLVVAPLFYLLTLVTGAPARRELRGAGQRVVAATAGRLTTISSPPSGEPIPSKAVEASFGARPFALTNALNAAVLLLANHFMS